MAINIYGYARMLFATKEIDWVDDDILAILADESYLPNYNSEKFISAAGEPLATTELTGRSVDSIGWIKCDPILFNSPPAYTPISQAVIYRSTDGVMLFRLSFPSVSNPKVTPLAIIKSATSAGLCRL